MKRLFYAFIFLLGMFSLNGQSVWIGAVDSEWTNPANWSAGVPTAGSVATIPANPVSPVFSGTPIINYTIQLAGDLTFNNFVFNAGTIIIFESGHVVNNGQFINANSQVLDVDGHFENNGTLDNFGMVDIAATGSMDNETGGVFNNRNTTLAFGPVMNAGTINNIGDINIIVGLDNFGEFNNFGTFESQAGSTVENRANAIMEILEGSSYSVNGIYNNLGQTRSRGDFIIQIASIFTNDNFLLSRTNGEMEVAGSLINNELVTINGGFMINSSGIVENNDRINNNTGIDIEICGNLFQLNTNNIGGSIQNNGSVYEINGTINETNLEFGETFDDVNDFPAPVAACKADAFLQLPEDGVVNFTAADIEQGRSYASCGAQLVSVTVSPTSFTDADVGVRIVTITVTDDNGNSASCDDFVTVLPFTPPMVLVDDPDITFECPEDVTVTPQAGAQFAPASFVIPEAETNCNPVNPSLVTICPDVSENISGFDYLGQVGDSKFYVSHNAVDWMTANTIAMRNGGQLVSIDNSIENVFIRHHINPASGSVWIGLRKFNRGDDFEWVSGADVGYTHWSTGEPNNTGNRVAARLQKSNGTWTDRAMEGNYFEFVMEITCQEVDDIPGFDFIGVHDGSLYYESQAANDYPWAEIGATDIGGTLVTINNEAENTFIRNAINPYSGSIWTGLSNNNNGDNFVWQSGEPVNYTNWNPGEPNQVHQNVAARLVKSSGNWTDKPTSTHYEYVVEIPIPAMPTVCTATGSITREFWSGIPGTSVSQIPVNTTPDLTEEISLFETPWDIGNDYGTRVRGFIHPTVSGNYRFWIATDDNGELWLSTNDDPANRTRIAHVPGHATSSQWNKYPEQRSALIHLEAGERYYIEALQKEGGGADNLVVRWTLPDGSIQEPIPGSVLSGIDQCDNSGSGSGDPELTVTQIVGPTSGGNFPVGETPIIIEVTDACGNLETCEFNVIVEENPAELEVIDCPTDITVNTLPGAVTAVVDFTEPSGTSDCFRGGPVSVVQNLGLESGEAFPIGNTQITYAVFDSCGNFEGCNFNVNVVEIAANIAVTCPDDLILQTDSNNGTVTATWVQPSATTDCFAGGLTSEQISGPANGSDLSVGTQEVIYVFTDACNNTELCIFNVIVNSCPDADGDGICAAEDCDDNDASLPAPAGTACNDGDSGTENDVIGADGCSCAGTPIPTCTVAGGQIAFLDGSVEQTICADDGIADPLDVNLFGPIGSNQQWIITDSDGTILGLPPAPPFDLEGVFAGTCLIYSVSFEDGITGLSADANVDGLGGCFELSNSVSIIRLVGSDCPGFIIDGDGDGVPFDEDCNDNDPSLPAEPGTTCDDGNPMTVNDAIGTDGCSCAGTVVAACVNEGGDADGDGICANVDCNDNDASLPAAQGTACDDGNPATQNDVIGEDGCSCAGTPVSSDPDCADIMVSTGAGNITIDGLNAPINSIQIFNSSWAEEFKCFADCDVPTQVVGVAEGVYFVKVSFYSANYQLLCEIQDYFTVSGDDPCAANGGDADGDGVCAANDCDDNDASLPAAAGTACDDGDAGTENDVIGADGCSCAGTTIVGACANEGGDADGDGVCADVDCNDNDASLPAAAGTACDDGDAGTENDVIGADGCSCAGTPISTGGCNPTLALSPGNLTVNGLNGVVNSVKVLDISNGWLDIVNCFGDCPTPASFDLPAGPYSVYVTVRDANYNIICDLTELITITDGCTTGASCNDGDDCTTGDAFDADCNCIGTPEADNDNDGLCALVDCDDNNASLPAAVGSACDDGNPETSGDVYQADGCTCAGVVEGACNPTATPVDNTIVIAGMSGPFNVVQVFNTADWSTEINCWGTCNDQTLDVDPGNYFVRLKVLDDSYQVVCEIEENIVVGSGSFSIAPETEFLHLFAREENRAVGLNWVNNSEYRNDYFVIERSIDGVNFTELKTVDAFGYDNRTVTNYQDQDFQPVLGDGFYRVRQVFEDGSLRYSNVEKVSFDIDLTEVGVFPNPTESEVQLSLVNFEGRSAVVQIYSPLGVLMDKVSVDEIQESPLRFNVANYQAGLYTITVKVDQRKIFSKRFVKIGL